MLVMNLGGMVAVAVVIALEKLVVRGPTIARLVGAVSIAAGLWSLQRRGKTNSAWRPPLGGPTVVRLKPDATYRDFFTGSLGLRSIP